MNAKERDLELDKKLLSSGFTEKDIAKIYRVVGNSSPDEIRKEIKTLSRTSSLLLLIIIIAMTAMLFNYDTLIADPIKQSAVIIITLIISIIAINFVVPLKLGVKSSFFILRNRK